MRSSWAGLCALAGAGLLAAGAGTPLAAQEAAVPELFGQVTRGTGVLPGAEVVLHRVSSDIAGEIDTAYADTTGGFRFTLPAVPREDTDGVVYFASVVHDGITYFGQPVARAVQLDSLYRVETYDTLTAPAGGASVPVGTRYIVASDEAEGWVLTDLFELDHQGLQTIVAPDGGITWRHPLPTGAHDAEAGGGDLAAEATVVVDGEVQLTGPISPGLRQFVLRYRVDALDGLELPLAPGTRVVEFLLREPAPDLDVEGLVPIAAVEMQPGVVFRRYAAETPTLDAVRIALAEEEMRLPVEWIAVGLSIVLTLAGLFAWSRRSAPGSGSAPGSSSGSTSGAAGPVRVPDVVDLRNTLLLEVARIDARLEGGGLDPEERERLAARRAELVARLARHG